MNEKRKSSAQATTPAGMQISLAKLIPLVLAGLVVLAVLSVLVPTTSSPAILPPCRTDRRRAREQDQKPVRSDFPATALRPSVVSRGDHRRDGCRSAAHVRTRPARRHPPGRRCGDHRRRPEHATLGTRHVRRSVRTVDSPPLARAALSGAKNGRTSYWARPFVSPLVNDTILNYRVALEQDGEVLAVLAAAVTSQAARHPAAAKPRTDCRS